MLASWLGPHVERGEVVTSQHAGQLYEALGFARPQGERVAPARVSTWIAASLPWRETLHSVLGLAAVVLMSFWDAHVVAERLPGRGGHADRREFPGSMQRREVAGVDPVGLHAVTSPTGESSWADDVPGNAERAERPVGLVAGGGPASCDWEFHTAATDESSHSRGPVHYLSVP